MSSHKDLIVWQKAMDLVVRVYDISQKFPDSEKFNLVSQVRRSAVSIPSNISEGHDRKMNGSFVQFLKIAYGSSAELETQILLAQRLHFVGEADSQSLLDHLVEIRKMLNKLIAVVATDAKN